METFCSVLNVLFIKRLYIDHFCNYGIKKPCSSRVYGFSEEGRYSYAYSASGDVTSLFCQGECEAGNNML